MRLPFAGLQTTVHGFGRHMHRLEGKYSLLAAYAGSSNLSAFKQSRMPHWLCSADWISRY